MDKGLFGKYMIHPGIMDSESVNMLQEITREFPYCQTAQLLYAKGLDNKKSIHYNSQLKLAAIYASDRKLLHNLIFSTGVSELDIFPNKSPFIKKEEPKKEEVKKDPVVPILKVDEKRPQVEEAKKEIIKESIVIEKPVESKVVATVKEEEKIADEEIKKIETILPEPKKEKLPPEQITNKVEEEKKEQLVEKKEKEEIPGFSTHSFSDWLKLAKEDVNLPAELNKEESKNVPSKNNMDLIDRFIELEPKISPGKKEFYSPINMARQSVVEDETFVTETLAKVYWEQGNLSKALRAYEILLLKYPKKSSYFAAQIKAIRKSLNIDK